jgi:hypothetical protein
MIPCIKTSWDAYKNTRSRNLCKPIRIGMGRRGHGICIVKEYPQVILMQIKV